MLLSVVRSVNFVSIHSFKMFSFVTIIALAATISAYPNPFNHDARSTTSQPQNMCGAPDASEIINNTPWIVYSMNYDYQVSFCLRHLSKVPIVDDVFRISMEAAVPASRVW